MVVIRVEHTDPLSGDAVSRSADCISASFIRKCLVSLRSCGIVTLSYLPCCAPSRGGLVEESGGAGVVHVPRGLMIGCSVQTLTQCG